MEKILSDNRLLIGGAAALIIIGALWFMTRDAAAPSFNPAQAGTSGNNTEATTNPRGSSPSTTSDGESVSIKDQAGGQSLNIASVTFTQTGWIAVRDDRGWTLGAKRFAPGTHSDVSMSLLRATIPGERYQALLYIDDGDGKFDLDKEILVTKSGGSVAGVTFTAQ